MFRRCASFLAILVFLAMLFTLAAYLWGPSKAVRFEKDPASDGSGHAEPFP